jgi:hypothetical protein
MTLLIMNDITYYGITNNDFTDNDSTYNTI